MQRSFLRDGHDLKEILSNLPVTLVILFLMLCFQINLKKFLSVCADLGLSDWQLFDPQDLEAGDNVM